MEFEPLASAASELRLLASAVAGTTVRLERAAVPTHARGRAIALGPEASSLDPLTLHRLVVAQATLIGVGSLADERARALVGQRHEVVRSYLGLEVVRAAAVLRSVLPSSYVDAVTTYGAKLAHPSSSAAESLELAVLRPFPQPPEWFGSIIPRAALRSAGELGAGERPSAAELAKRLAPAESPDESPADERSALLEKLSGPLSSPLGRAFQRLLGTRSASGEGAVGMGVTAAFHRAAPTAGHGCAAPIAVTPDLRPSPRRGAVLGQQHPEWHEDRSVYRPRWCTVSVLDPAPTPGAELPARWSDRDLTRGLAAVSPTRSAAPRRADGHDLDLTALVDYRLAALAGVPTDPRIYRGTTRAAGDLGVLLLLDCTGSALEQQADGRRLFEEQWEIVQQLAESLASLDLRFAVQGFRSRGRHDVRLLHCKGFEDRWDLRSRRRLHAIEPSGFTRLGAVVRHGSGLLRTGADSSRSLLVVVSDAVAYDDGYEGGYAVADVRKAIAEAEQGGIACVGISSRQHAALGEVWGPAKHAVVDEPRTLAATAPLLFRRALESTRMHSLTATRRVG